MKTQTVIIAIAVAVLLTGCASTEKRINEISLGMNKAQVIRVLGQPKSTRASAGVEYLLYDLKESTNVGECVATAYGEIGDFDSTQDPEQTININKTIKFQE